MKLNRPPQILDINIKLPLRNYIREVFWCKCYNSSISSTNGYANVFHNSSNSRPRFNKNKYSFWFYFLYICKSFQMSILHQHTKSPDIIFFASTNTGMSNPLILLELHHFTDREIFHSQNFIKKNISFNVIGSLLATNGTEPICISVVLRKVRSDII